MRGSPVRNLVCVIALLAVMAAAVSLATRRSGAGKETTPPERLAQSDTVEMDIRMRFSHLPKHVSLIPAGAEDAVIDVKPSDNYIEKSLTLPADRVSEFLLDIEWPEREHAVYFVMITQRREGLEDVDVILTSDDLVFSSVLTIDPGSVKP